MALEDLTGPNKFISDLVITNPESTDVGTQGDDHLRGIKNTLANSFPNVNGAVTATDEELNTMDGILASTTELNNMVGSTINVQAELDAIRAIAEAAQPAANLIGQVANWCTAAVPAGWLEMRGQAISSTNYPLLVEVLNPGQSTAVVPDMRGEFARGWANDRVGLDDARVITSTQTDLIKDHVHITSVTTGGGSGGTQNNPRSYNQDIGKTGPNVSSYPEAYDDWQLGALETGIETRPYNVALMFIIKHD